jgi:hypothetical protein
MTFAPPTLVTLGKYLVSQGAVNLGIKGDTAHIAKGWSYHLGADDLAVGASSARLPRDVAGLSDAASAIDIGTVGGTLTGLQKLSVWLSRECANRAIDTLDIRELIYSPDGVKVFRWDEPTGKVYESKFVDGRWTQGDLSHRQHTHTSWYRDSEFRDHTALFRRYFEEDEVITAIKGEDWTPTKSATGTSNGVLRRTPDAGAPIIARLTLDQVARSIAHVTTSAATDSEWVLTQYGPEPAYMLVRDWVLVVDPLTAKGLTDYLNQKPAIDCTPLVNAARAEGVAAGLRDGSRAVKDAAVNAAVLLGG